MDPVEQADALQQVADAYRDTAGAAQIMADQLAALAVLHRQLAAEYGKLASLERERSPHSATERRAKGG